MGKAGPIQTPKGNRLHLLLLLDILLKLIVCSQSHEGSLIAAAICWVIRGHLIVSPSRSRFQGNSVLYLSLQFLTHNETFFVLRSFKSSFFHFLYISAAYHHQSGVETCEGAGDCEVPNQVKKKKKFQLKCYRSKDPESDFMAPSSV